MVEQWHQEGEKKQQLRQISKVCTDKESTNAHYAQPSTSEGPKRRRFDTTADAKSSSSSIETFKSTTRSSHAQVTASRCDESDGPQREKADSTINARSTEHNAHKKTEEPESTGNKQHNLNDKTSEINDVICGIQCYYTNAAGVMNKRLELETNIEIYQPKIIGVVESWCNSSVLDGEMSFEGYNLFRKDKVGSDGIGGGILLYIHKSLEAAQCYKFDSIEMETSIWCEVKLTGNEVLLVGVVYKSPNTTDQNSEAMRHQIAMIDSIPYITHKLVFGDFNFPEINWDTNIVRGGINSEPQLFMDTVQDLMLVQHVVKDTRRREGQKPSRLDLVFSHDENSIDEITHTAAIGKSDHDSLTWTYICHADSICSNREQLNFAKGDYTAIQREFEETDWDRAAESAGARERRS